MRSFDVLKNKHDNDESVPGTCLKQISLWQRHLRNTSIQVVQCTLYLWSFKVCFNFALCDEAHDVGSKCGPCD